MQLVRLILVALVLAGVSACNSPVRSVAQGCAPSYDLNVDASFYASSTPVSHRYEQDIEATCDVPEGEGAERLRALLRFEEGFGPVSGSESYEEKDTLRLGGRYRPAETRKRIEYKEQEEWDGCLVYLPGGDHCLGLTLETGTEVDAKVNNPRKRSERKRRAR